IGPAAAPGNNGQPEDSPAGWSRDRDDTLDDMTARTAVSNGHGEAPPACEVCGRSVLEWRIGPTCALWRCPSCEHVMRDLGRCSAHAREHAWGGDAGFDRVRTWLTMRSLSEILPARRGLDVLEIGFGRGLLLER